jgi:beta-N-acetylhexosaminidase
VSRLSPTAAPLVALATVVLLAGVATVVAVPDAPLPPPPAAAPELSPSPAAAPQQVVPLSVRPAARAVPVAHDPGDPSTWPTRQLAAQLVFSCVQSSDLGTAVAHARAGIGGITVLGRPTDPAALADGLANVRAAAPDGISPVAASDEEGGRVQRLKGLLGPLPSAAVMGRWPDARIEQTAHDYALGMRRLGLQLALSPVADLAAPGGYPAATERAFSADPQRVAGAAVAWSRGLERGGVLSTVKHWPGHGQAIDSHTSAPVVPPLAALQGRDLLPFDAVLRSGARVVMVGHLRSEGLTEPGLPASLSPNALRVLRERAGADTVLLTDSLSMAASSSALGLRPADAAVRALQAGADWAMSCVDPLLAVDAVEAALAAGHLPRPAAVASARRLLEVKQRLGLLVVPPTSAAPSGAVESAELTEDVVTISGRAVDPDTPESPRVRVLVDGAAVVEVLPDVSTRAFVVAVPTRHGAEVCVVALNTGPGPSTSLGCVTRP